MQFVEILGSHRIRIEIWERGAGYTLASGSSSCAAAAACVRLGLCSGTITVEMPGGSLEIGAGDDFALTMLGPVGKVAEGTASAEVLRHTSNSASHPITKSIAGRPDSSSDFTVRPSVEADAEQVWCCLDSVARELRYIAMVEPPTLEEVQAFLRTLAERGVIQFLAVAGSQVVGWCDMTRKPVEGFRHSAVLGMGVLHPYRGRGLGRALLRAVLDAARLRGLSRIEPEVYTSNRSAIALYERFGFTREGIKRSARILDGDVEDILCMALLLPPLEHAAG